MEYRILIADDEPQMVSFLHEWLEEKVLAAFPANHVIYEAANGVEALAKAAECQAAGHRLDLAIIDVIMPRKSGIQVIDDLLRISPSTKVVVLSATADFYREEMQERYGPKITVMGKPVALKEFKAVVSNLLHVGKNQA